MALSEDEQRSLDEMEIALRRDDPEFVASVSIIRVRRRRRTVLAVFFLAGMVILIGGLVTTAENVTVGVVISLIGVLIMVTVAGTMFRWRRR